MIVENLQVSYVTCPNLIYLYVLLKYQHVFHDFQLQGDVQQCCLEPSTTAYITFIFCLSFFVVFNSEETFNAGV